MAAAAFMIRDGHLRGANISILEAARVMGGSLDGAGDPATGYSMRGGRMLTTENYECTWDLYKSIPSLIHKGKTVFDETVEFNDKIQGELAGEAGGPPSCEGSGDFDGLLHDGPNRIAKTQPM
jgi:oleate hydratase